MKNVLIVSATRSNRVEFERFSRLGISLRKLSYEKRISSDITYDNCGPSVEGLSMIYNRFLTQEHLKSILLFVHDDVYIDDFFLFYRLNEAIKTFDVVGLAGSQAPDLDQPTWGFEQNESVPAGAVAHVKDTGEETVTRYGETPAKCQLLDGCFLAINACKVVNAGAKFDPQFDFHFYDLDFCRTCSSRGLNLGTWPVAVTHGGKGHYGSPEWEALKTKYFDKWKSHP